MFLKTFISRFDIFPGMTNRIKSTCHSKLEYHHSLIIVSFAHDIIFRSSNVSKPCNRKSGKWPLILAHSCHIFKPKLFVMTYNVKNYRLVTCLVRYWSFVSKEWFWLCLVCDLQLVTCAWFGHAAHHICHIAMSGSGNLTLTVY